MSALMTVSHTHKVNANTLKTIQQMNILQTGKIIVDFAEMACSLNVTIRFVRF